VPPLLVLMTCFVDESFAVIPKRPGVYGTLERACPTRITATERQGCCSAFDTSMTDSFNHYVATTLIWRVLEV
jgi:hypothetical protein